MWLSCWKLIENYGEDKTKALGRGFVSGHHRLNEGTYVYTSYIEELELCIEEKCLKMRTHSGSLYRLDWGQINLAEIENTKKVLERFQIPTEFLQECEKLSEEMRRTEEEYADAVLGENELLYLLSSYKAYFKNAEGIVNEVEVYTHVGTFQDSVLISSYEAGVDFRYFPKGWAELIIEPYHWSNGLRAVLIKNDGTKDVLFQGSDKMITCKGETVTRIESSQYLGEGLFSPDMVDGKCVFTKFLEKENTMEEKMNNSTEEEMDFLLDEDDGDLEDEEFDGWCEDFDDYDDYDEDYVDSDECYEDNFVCQNVGSCNCICDEDCDCEGRCDTCENFGCDEYCNVCYHRFED